MITTPVGGLCTIIFSILALMILVADFADVFVNPKMSKAERCIFYDYDAEEPPL